MTFRFPGALSLVLSLLSIFAPASAELSKEPICARWELVAQADLIARVRLTVPLVALNASLETEKYSYINLQANIEEIVKGSAPQQAVSVRYYTKPDDSGKPSARFLEKCNGKEVIVFLVQIDSGEVGLYFAGNTPVAVSPFDANEFRAIAREVEQQQEIVHRFDSDKIPMDKLPAEAKIRRLFDELTSKQTQQQAWEQLLKLSRRDVPAIVRAMDDERHLARRYAYVPTPDGFEATAQYGPPRIVEAASLLLTYLTKTSFRAVFNGGSDREVRADVNGWRVWCHYNF